MVSALFEQIRDLGWIQWSAFISGLAYIFYATKDDVQCWPWGIVSSGLWAYASFYQLKLYSDAWLQIIYIVLGAWGWHHWKYKLSKQEKPISRLSLHQWVIYLTVGSALALMIGYLMKKTNAAFPMIDAYLSVFSVAATILLINKKIENWYCWIVIDLVNIPVFILRKGYLFSVLFLIYALLAIKGLIDWNQKINQDKSSI